MTAAGQQAGSHPGSQTQRFIYSPSTLNREVRFQLEQGFAAIWLEGEVSNHSAPRSGHVYFTLKDSKAQVRCAWFRSRNHWSKVTVGNGQKVVVRGKLSLFEPRGDYQFIVDYLEDAGEGELRRQFDALKARLAAEGVFAQAGARPLPRFPRRIAVITAPQGAALQDVRSALARRYPLADLLLIATRVQGEGAALQLRSALREAIGARPDVILMTRGGGSLEDLWPFNDDLLAREIAASPIPVVSAVGHEVDFTIADFAADHRAATPTAGAELITPDRREIGGLLLRHERALVRCQRVFLERTEQYHDQLRARLDNASPNRDLVRYAEALDRATRQATRTTIDRLERQRERVDQLLRRLQALHPKRRLVLQSQRLASLQARVRASSARLLRELAAVSPASRTTQAANTLRSQLEHLEARRQKASERIHASIEDFLAHRGRSIADHRRSLEQLSPVAILERGYSVTFDAEGRQVIRGITDLQKGQRLRTRFKDGEAESEVIETHDNRS